MIVSLRCDCAFFLEKLEIIMCRLWRPECVARQFSLSSSASKRLRTELLLTSLSGNMYSSTDTPNIVTS